MTATTTRLFAVALLAAISFGLGGCGLSLGIGPSFDQSFDGGYSGGSADIEAVRQPAAHKQYFDAYVLKAVDFLYNKYRLLGYDKNSLYTHDLPYGPFGFIKGTPGPKTMCVAAQVEVILTAMDIYARETGDRSVYQYLPEESWKGLTVNDIKGHIWVNSKFHSSGTADALAHFGMGERVAFESLRPGAFINFNRTKGNGHAVTFIAFIDQEGKELEQYSKSVIGFKYFSAQGLHDPDGGGLDYRYAVFSQFGCPETLPYKRDCEIIYSKNQRVFNVGRMWAPSSWHHPAQAMSLTPSMQTMGSGELLGESVFDAEHFDGTTTDDER